MSRLAIAGVLSFGAALVLCFAFLIAHEHEEDDLSDRGVLTRAQANSFKHAVAAYRTGRVLRGVGLPPGLTRALVRKAGEWTERVELQLDWTRDTSAEMLRDMANNELGLALALQAPPNGKRVLIDMAATDALFTTREALTIAPNELRRLNGIRDVDEALVALQALIEARRDR